MAGCQRSVRVFTLAAYDKFDNLFTGSGFIFFWSYYHLGQSPKRKHLRIVVLFTACHHYDRHTVMTA